MSWSISSKGKNCHDTIESLRTQAQSLPKLNADEDMLKSQALCLMLSTIGTQSRDNLIDVEAFGSCSHGNGDLCSHSITVRINAQLVEPKKADESSEPVGAPAAESSSDEK